MFTFISYLFLSMILSMVFCSSPIILGVWVFFSALTLSFLLNLLTTSWFSMLLFLIYIGGMLVMFAYFIAIEPNQHLGMLKLLLMLSFTNALLHVSYYTMNVMPMFLNNTLFPPSISFHLFPKTIFILILMVTLLFLALIIIVKITYLFKAPLRPFSYVLPHS